MTPTADGLPVSRNDSIIAEAAGNALSWYRAVAPGSVRIIVSNGWLTLTGVVADLQERGAAERAVRNLLGVRGVSNALMVRRVPAYCTPQLEFESMRDRRN